jgi:hypothetical protein
MAKGHNVHPANEVPVTAVGLELAVVHHRRALHIKWALRLQLHTVTNTLQLKIPAMLCEIYKLPRCFDTI